MQRERIVAAACGSQRIVVASYRREPGGSWWLEAAQVREVPHGGDWLGELVLALADARWDHRHASRLVISPPPELVWLKSVRVPRLDSAPRSAVLRFELEQATPFPPDSVAGAAILAARGESDDEHLLAVLKQDLAARIAASFDAVHLAPRIVPLATRLPALVAAPAAGSSALVLLDPASSLLVLAHRDGVAVRAVAHARLNHEPPDRLAALLAADVLRAMAMLRHQAGAAAILETRLAGPDFLVGLACEAMSGRTDTPVVPFASPEIHSHAVVPAVELAGTLALARGEFDAAEPIDLTPPHLRRERELRPRRRVWAASAVFALLAGGVLATRLQLDFSQAERRAARLEKELTPLRELAAERRTQSERLSRITETVAELRKLERARGQAAGLLARLSEVLAESGGVWIERLEWREAANVSAPVPPLPVPGRRELPPRLRLVGVVPAADNARGPALVHARNLVKRLASMPSILGTEYERFDDRHREGVGFQSDLILDWEETP